MYRISLIGYLATTMQIYTIFNYTIKFKIKKNPLCPNHPHIRDGWDSNWNGWSTNIFFPVISVTKLKVIIINLNVILLEIQGGTASCMLRSPIPV